MAPYLEGVPSPPSPQCGPDSFLARCHLWLKFAPVWGWSVLALLRGFLSGFFPPQKQQPV